MFQLYRRIHGIFISTSALSSRILHLPARTFVSSTVEPLTKPDEPPANRSIYDLTHEPDLRKMVDKFKLLSSDPSFRKRSKLYSEIIGRLTLAKKFSWIEEILEDQRQYMSFPDNERFIRGVILQYGNAGMLEHARKLFDEMPQLNCNPTVKSFNCLLDACIKSDRLDQIVEIFRQIPPKFSITPNVICYTTLIRAYSKMGSLDHMLSIVNEMEERGVKPDSVTYAFLLDALYKNGRVSEGDDVWESMRSKGVVPCIGCYNSKLFFLVSEKRIKEAVEVFNGLESQGLKPNKLTFCAMLNGFCEDRNLENAKMWWNKMGRKDCRGSRTICEILVPFATQMGDFGFALALCRAAVTQRSLLSEATLQGVLDLLVKKSKVGEAKKLLEDFQGYGGGVYTCEVKKTAF